LLITSYVEVPEKPVLDFVTKNVSFGSPQFMITKVEIALLNLNNGKGLGLMVCLHLCAFALPVSANFNKSFATFVVPDAWKFSFVTHIFTNIDETMKETIGELLLVYDHLKNLISAK
jgi:hypothetical protein